ncbi:MAG: glycerol-3-phosphate dehydrogenase/oxidase [Deltaproteobacteria bacterium]|nr:glycerol-3-phosphate dehydrogenase/oxidase [Deltaproteobacteria bacterium]
MDLDLIVIGGGVNGCGIARDAAMRGFKTALIEKNDFGSGTTGASSQMIHGGARYLLSDVQTTKLSSIDSGYIQKIVPHLLFRIPFIFPVLRKPNRGEFLQKMYFEGIETYFESYDKYSALKNGKPHTRLSPEEALALEPDLVEGMVGAVTFDEWGIDSFRLCLGNVMSAAEHGCEILNHTEVTEIQKEGGRVVGVRVKSALDGSRRELRAKIVFNAAGPWVPKIAELAGCEIKLRPAKGVHLVLDRRISNYALMATAIDGRNIFMMPYQNTTIVGTTDDDYFGDPDEIPILEDEVEYLLEGIEQVFPRIRQARVINAWAGVRPTLYRRGPSEDELSRAHEIFDHEYRDRLPGFLSIAGGKLAAYRMMSQEAVDLVSYKLGRISPCRTHQVPLPGGEREVNPEELAREYHVPLFAANRLVYRHGARSIRILEMLREKPTFGNVICQCEPVLECELRYAVRHEWARSLGDLRRRTRYSIGPCEGTRCFMMGARILGEEMDWSPSKVYSHLNAFMEKSWKGRAPVLDGVSLQQEELCSSTYFNVGSLDQY